jgi:hypothetical protein
MKQLEIFEINRLCARCRRACKCKQSSAVVIESCPQREEEQTGEENDRENEAEG